MFMPSPFRRTGSFRDGRSTSRANETGLGPNNSLAAILCCMSERPSWAAHRADEKGRSATVVEVEATAIVNAYADK